MHGLTSICGSFFDWLIMTHEFEKLRESELEISGEILWVPGKQQPGTTPTRTINYWSKSGQFFQWRYTAATLQATHQHISFFADDPAIEFTWDDAVIAHELIRLTELTMDCQDVVGF